MDKFTLSTESNIGNSKMPIFDPSKPNEIYYKPFEDDMLEEENVLPYGDELVDVKVTETNEPYIEELDNLIGSQVKLLDKGGVPL